MSILGKIGEPVLRKWRTSRHVAAVMYGAVWLALRPSSWRRTVREQLAKQVLFTGVDALGLVMLVAVLAGVSIVSQAQFWLSTFGQSDIMGPLMVATIVRTVGPMLVNFVVIGRSGTAIVTELATMRVHKEVEFLDAQGVDPMTYLIMPRIIGMAISVFSLTIVFIAGSLAAGFLTSLFLGVGTRTPVAFINSVLLPIGPVDVLDLIAKATVPGLLTGAICCIEGLSISGAATDVPQAATRAVVRSISALLIVSAISSILAYI